MICIYIACLRCCKICTESIGVGTVRVDDQCSLMWIYPVRAVRQLPGYHREYEGRTSGCSAHGFPFNSFCLTILSQRLNVKGADGNILQQQLVFLWRSEFGTMSQAFHRVCGCQLQNISKRQNNRV